MGTDATTRDRIRDAALSRFAFDGFEVGLRTIAADAGVSAGLITHHFGSKAALRAECDEYVLVFLTDGQPRDLSVSTIDRLVARTGAEELVRVLHYMVRVFHDGGPSAGDLLAVLVADVRRRICQGIAHGTVRPSSDEDARAHTIALHAVGALTLEFSMCPPRDLGDARRFIRRYYEQSLGPLLQVDCEEWFADRGPGAGVRPAAVSPARSA